MTKKFRLIILISCVICFFVVAPILVAYSEGYRFDFAKMKIVATGGIYVRTFPAADKITVDSAISEKPGLFSNNIFVQSLLPESHSVAIKKTGYYDYNKTLSVEENQVTKLENIFLFKKNISFADLAGKVDYFSITPNNQNILTAGAGESPASNSITFNYFPANASSQPKTFSISASGTVSGVTWSDDSSRALIYIKTYSNGMPSLSYYLFNSASAKPVATRLSYLDKNSQFAAFNPQDPQTIFYIKKRTLYSAKKTAVSPIINNIISFKISGTNIIWLSTKGALSESDFSGKLISALSSQNFPVDSQKTYEILLLSGNTFLKTDNSLFKLNQTAKTFENLTAPLNSYKISASGNNKNWIYWNSDKIYLYSLEDTDFSKAGQLKQIFSGSQINNLQWINNDYIIFTSGDKIIISEIDYRGNINSTTFPQAINLAHPSAPLKQISIKNPQIFFNQQDGKLYILTQNSLLSSEKLIP